MSTTDDDDRPPGRALASRAEPSALSVDQAAERVGVHPQTIRNWIAAGDLPVTRFGPRRGIIRIHVDDLAEVAGPH